MAQKEGEKEQEREQKKKVKQEKRKGETGEGYSEAEKRKEITRPHAGRYHSNPCKVKKQRKNSIQNLQMLSRLWGKKGGEESPTESPPQK